ESTFLQLFIKKLGGSSFIVGLIPSFFFVGIAVSAVLAGYLTSHMRYKKKAVIVTHALGSIPFIIFGGILFLRGSENLILVTFFSLYAVFSISIGLLAPIWQNYLVKIFSENKVFPALAVMMVTQSLAKILSSFFLARIIYSYAFSLISSAVVFLLVGLFFLIGAFMFLPTREEPENEADLKKASSVVQHFTGSISRIVKNRNFLYFIISDFETVAVVAVISFYANYATAFCNIKPSIAGGYFTAFIYAGGIVINIALGWFGLLKMKQKFILSKLVSIAAVLLLILFSSTVVFLLASFLLGVSRSIRTLTFSPAVKRLSGKADATDYFAASMLLGLPISSTLTLFCGKFLDVFRGLEAASFKIMFGGLGCIIAGSLYFIMRTDFSVKISE
ncbi:MAG: MFS transporter, partial [Spirochaetota bacterium]